MSALVQVSQPDPNAPAWQKAIQSLFGGSPVQQAEGMLSPLNLPETEIQRLVQMLLSGKGKYLGQGVEAVVKHLGEVPGIGNVVGKLLSSDKAVSGLPWDEVVKLAQKLQSVPDLMLTRSQGGNPIILQRAVGKAAQLPHGVKMSDLLNMIRAAASEQGIYAGDLHPSNVIYGDVHPAGRRAWYTDVGGIRPRTGTDDVSDVINPDQWQKIIDFVNRKK